jgi:hypothetical protein
MKHSLAFLTVIALAGCGGASTPSTTTTTPPASPGMAGDFTRQDPEHPTVLRFASDGTCLVGSNAAALEKPSHRCTWKLDGKRLTFTNAEGMCADPEPMRVGVYEVELTEASVTFKLVDDRCESRMSIDGQTWLRAKSTP